MVSNAFLYTASLSQKTRAAPLSGTPIILSLYLSAMICSVAIFRAINSLEYVLDSTVFCYLEYHDIGAMFRKIMMPACDRRVTAFPA